MADKSSPSSSGSPATVILKKSEAVKRVLEKLGKKALPREIVSEVKSQFGLDISTDYAGKVKTEVFGKVGRRKVSRRTPPGKKLEKTPDQHRDPASNGEAATAIPLTDLLTLRDLVDRLGADHIRTVLSLMVR